MVYVRIIPQEVLHNPVRLLLRNKLVIQAEHSLPMRVANTEIQLLFSQTPLEQKATQVTFLKLPVNKLAEDLQQIILLLIVVQGHKHVADFHLSFVVAVLVPFL